MEPAADSCPEDRGYFSPAWGGLAWSPWVPFNVPREEFAIPKVPGIYRIRPAGKDCLLYVGGTGQSLHKKLAELRQALRRGNLMPWSDPHAEAPVLWAYWVEWAAAAQSSGAAPVMLECSAAPLDASAAGRQAMATFLLSSYRQEHGSSPPGNFGRFHPRYRKSSTRKEGRRGGRLADSQKDNPAGWPGTEPLVPEGAPGESGWMGLEWTAWQPLEEGAIEDVSPGAGLYLLADAGSREIVYIGQSPDVKERLAAHAAKDGNGLLFSYQIVGHYVLPHHLKELECDLLGNFFEQYRRAPERQFRTGR